jgi:hypothetical protein
MGSLKDSATVLYGATPEEDKQTSISSKAPPEDFLLTAKSWFRRDIEHSSEWRKAAHECYEFAALRQVSDADKEKLRQEMRPHVVFDRIGPVIQAVSGMEIQNRQETRYIPRTQGDVQVNEVLTAAGKFLTDECDAEVEDSDAFLDAVVCGMGWSESRIDFDDDPEGTYIRERVDPMEMVWDCAARKRNLTDAKRFWRVRDMPTADAKEMFPGFEAYQLHANWASDLDVSDEEPKSADKRLNYNREDAPVTDPGDNVRIVHLQWREKAIDNVRFADPFTGEKQEMGIGEFGVLEGRLKELGIALKSQTLTKDCWYQTFIGSELLGEKEKNLCPERSTWECITGRRDRNKGTFFGLVASMMDPQRWANKWLSQSLHIMNVQAKGGPMAERGAFEDPAQAERDWANPDAFVWLNANATAQGKVPVPRVAPPMANDPAKYIDLAHKAIQDGSGVNLELMGLVDRDQPGILEHQRKQAGMTILAHLFDNLRRYRQRTGRTLLYYITEYLSDGRLIRIVGDEMEQYVPLLEDKSVSTFDVIVDESPTSPNQKEQIWGMLLQMMPMLKDMLPPQAWLKLAKYSPLPTSVIQEVEEATAKAMQQQAEQPSPEQMKMEAEQQKLQAQIEAKQAETEMNLRAKQQETAMDMRAMEMEFAFKQEELKLKQQAQAFDLHHKQQAQAMDHDFRRQGHELDRAHSTESKRIDLAKRANPETGEVEADSDLAPLIKSLVETQISSTEALVGGMQDMTGKIVKAATAPKRIVTDKSGNPIGSETVI